MQGLTGAAGLVISKAIIADSFTGQDVARYFAVLAAVQGVAPIVAPVVGGVAFSLTSWQGTFAVLGIWALGLLAVCRRMPESLAEKDRLQMPVWKTFRCYVPVVTNGKYLVMNLLQSFSAAALIAYISASPFIFQQHFGLTPLQYSICFAGNALGLVVGSSVVMKIRRLASATPWCSVGLFVTGLLMSVALWLERPFVLFELVLVPMLFCIGMITPVGITLALNSVTEHRGHRLRPAGGPAVPVRRHRGTAHRPRRYDPLDDHARFALLGHLPGALSLFAPVGLLGAGKLTSRHL